MNLKKLYETKTNFGLSIGIIILICGIIPLITFTFYADFRNPYTIKEITLKSEDNTNIQALVYTPLNEEEQHPGVVVAHGFCGNKQYMQPISIELVKRGFTVISIDFRGHGSSDGYLPTFRRARGIGELEHDMLAAIDYLNNLSTINKIGLVGHSMGGRTALNVAENFPHRINATVSFGMIDNDREFYKISNLLMLIGQYEQIFSAEKGIEFLKEYTRQDEVELNTLYGDFNTGRATKVVLGPTSEHLAEVIDPVLINEMIQWFEQAFNGEEASDVTLTVIPFQISMILTITGLVMVLFIIISFVSKLFWNQGMAYPEREIARTVSVKKLVPLYILGNLVGVVFLIPLALLFAVALPVSMGHMLYAYMVSTVIGLTIIFYVFIIKLNEHSNGTALLQKVQESMRVESKKSLLFGILTAIIVTITISLTIHWTITASIPTTREYGAIFSMSILFFPFLLMKEFYFRTIQGQLKQDNVFKEYFTMTGLGIFIENMLLIPLMLLLWQNDSHDLAFIALALTAVVIFSIIQSCLVTWIYMHSGRNIVGSAVFISIFYAWLIIGFFPFGFNSGLF